MHFLILYTRNNIFKNKLSGCAFSIKVLERRGLIFLRIHISYSEPIRIMGGFPYKNNEPNNEPSDILCANDIRTRRPSFPRYMQSLVVSQLCLFIPQSRSLQLVTSIYSC